jgi:pyridoxine 5-phosphate synthase
MTSLSVNINKFATIRNSRGGNVPDVVKAALDCVRFGAEGITVHPRPDERHIRYADVRAIRPLLRVEFNMEGYPSEEFLRLVEEVIPDQVTFVPDAHDAITSNAGWDTVKHQDFLCKIVNRMHALKIRTSLFVGTDIAHIAAAATTGTDRVELYTEPYALEYPVDREAAIRPFMEAAKKAGELGLALNAGHDLSLENLAFFAARISGLLEVSIGHALISDALYFGLENTIQLYLRQLKTHQ